MPETGTGTEHWTRALAVSFAVALACSLVVALAAVGLKPLITQNRLDYRLRVMEGIIAERGGAVQSRLVELASGNYTTANPGTMSDIPPAGDSAGLVVREDVATVYELVRDGKIEMLVLPVRGRGYQSLLEGFLALESDFNTVAALSFYQHDETPGLGANISTPGWQRQWAGKMIRDESAQIAIDVTQEGASGPFQVDGISGATRTGSGVEGLVRFWMGDDGYGKYIRRLQGGG